MLIQCLPCSLQREVVADVQLCDIRYYVIASALNSENDQVTVVWSYRGILSYLPESNEAGSRFRLDQTND